MKRKLTFGAVIFDLDGVITKTALVHSSAWTRMFNDYLISGEKNITKNTKSLHTSRTTSICRWKTTIQGSIRFS